ncbi:MAG: phosphoribosylaminoimidazolecarboxamide formyltransferase/IMP cyclohydrolase [Candidatus Deianiraeaceae bacterium]|jgi:phosphoribosylaminoimidazolecarboxamide formyltransferase/IMP cyclohydrolase
MQPIKRVLISVSNKENIVELATFLHKNGVEIISTGGTYKLLLQHNIPAIEVSSYTQFPEMMDGRLKTLHPKIHGGLLGREQDTKNMKEHSIQSIDLTIVNLYPFEETLQKTNEHSTIIENIDIGGPSMVRSTAKNHKYKTIVTNPSDYTPLIEHLVANNFCTTLEFRQQMAGKAFALTAYYDAIISQYFSSTFEIDTPLKTLTFNNKTKLRYGENPHQKASSYTDNTQGFMNFKQLNGKELSYNNINDANSAFNISCFFEEPTSVIVKHATPCGIATANTIEQAYTDALNADKTSAFGGIVAINREISTSVAEEISKHFFEVIIAPSFAEDALSILQKKKNLRLLEIPFLNSQDTQYSFINGGLLEQECDMIKIQPTDFEIKNGLMTNIDDAIFSFTAVRFLKSNAIVITQGTKFISFGSGQTSRIDSMKIALEQAKSKNIDFSSCILSSDAFFPFKDNIDLAASYGIQNIISPAGSIRDEEVINCAKEHNINLIFAKTRHFMH